VILHIQLHKSTLFIYFKAIYTFLLFVIYISFLVYLTLSLFNLCKMEELHIGECIKKRATELRIGATELGNLINTSKQNIYGIYKRRTIDTGLLKKLSAALDYDFFDLYSKVAISSGDHTDSDNFESLYQDIEQMRNEIEELKVKYESLEKKRM